MKATTKITLNDRRKIFAIQEEFSALFPYLKIEFQAKSSAAKGTHASKLVNNSKTLGECRTSHTSSKLVISPAMTVADLEELFLNEYGLSIQVWRKSGRLWLETTVTDGWTLQDQNHQGEALSKMAS